MNSVVNRFQIELYLGQTQLELLKVIDRPVVNRFQIELYLGQTQHDEIEEFVDAGCESLSN